TSLLERLRRRTLQLGRDAVDVLRVLQEVLEELELTLTGGRAERRRLQVGEVEAGDLRRGEALRRRFRQRVAVGGQRNLLVRRGEAAALGPDPRRLRRRQIADQRARRWAVLEHDDVVSADDHRGGRAV